MFKHSPGAALLLAVLAWAAPVHAQLSPPVAELPQPRLAADAALDVVEFRDITLHDAMRLLSQQTGMKIVASAEAGKLKTSFYLENVTPLVAVDALSRANGLIYRRDPESGIVRIYTTKENQRDLTCFREDNTEVFTLLYPNAVNAATAIRDLFGSRVLLSYGASDERTIQDLQQRLERFDLINSRGLGLGTFQGSAGVGGPGVGGTGGIGNVGVAGINGAGSVAGTGGRLNGNEQVGGPVLRDPRRADSRPEQRLDGLTPEEIQELETSFANKEAPDRTMLLELLRRRPATIYVTVIKEHNQIIVRTSDPATLQQIRDLVARLDVPTPVVLLEVKVLQIDLRDDFTSIFDYQFTDGVLNAGGFTTGNILPPFADALSSGQRRFAPLNPGPRGGDPGQNLTYQVVSSNFRARLQLLESKNRVTELATPLLMTANNEVSRIFTGETRPITIGFTPSQVVGNGLAPPTSIIGSPITTLQDLGTSLLITPNINADRTVTLRIVQETSSVNPNGGSIPVPNGNGSVTQVLVDTVQRQTVSGTIVAQDGLAIALGGLIQESVSDARSEVPGIGKVPYLGFFFRRQITERSRKELVVMVRPFVLSTPCESASASRFVLDALSIHPNAPEGGMGTLGTYLPPEVPRPNPPETQLQNIFRGHTILPRDY